MLECSVDIKHVWTVGVKHILYEGFNPVYILDIRALD